MKRKGNKHFVESPCLHSLHVNSSHKFVLYCEYAKKGLVKEQSMWVEWLNLHIWRYKISIIFIYFITITWSESAEWRLLLKQYLKPTFCISFQNYVILSSDQFTTEYFRAFLFEATANSRIFFFRFWSFKISELSNNHANRNSFHYNILDLYVQF